MTASPRTATAAPPAPRTVRDIGRSLADQIAALTSPDRAHVGSGYRVLSSVELDHSPAIAVTVELDATPWPSVHGQLRQVVRGWGLRLEKLTIAHKGRADAAGRCPCIAVAVLVA